MTFEKRPSICTSSGIEFNPFDLDPEMIVTSDIAHALAHICRYMGHCPRFYSVAEHSLNVTRLLEFDYPGNFKLHLMGLLHDASEAYLFDLPRPFKKIMPEYREIESQVQSVIYKKFVGETTEEELKLVHEADRDIFRGELLHLWGRKRPYWWTEDPPSDYAARIGYTGFPAEEARALFSSKLRFLNESLS